MDSLPVRRIEALPGATRQQAYLRIQEICCMRSERTFSESEIAKKAGFHTEEGMYHWLESWGVTGLLPPEKQAESPKPNTIDTMPKQKARSSGQPQELPNASAAAELFNDALDELTETVKMLEHLSLVYQGGRFAGTYTFEGSWLWPLNGSSEERWQELGAQDDEDPDIESVAVRSAMSNHPTEAGPYPPREVVMLIAAYALTGRPIEPLLKVLYPEHSEADIEEINKLRYETKFAGGSQNGLLRTAQQFAAAVYGRKVGRGAPAEQPPEQSAGEHLLACHITERREAGLTDEEIRQEILDSGRELSNEEFARLAKLERRFPTT
jgi:hypothetical protein